MTILKRGNTMREEILEILQDVMPGVDFENSKSLADDGIIDSVNVVNIVTELAIAFDIQVPFEALVNENFNSLDAIVALVKSLQGK